MKPIIGITAAIKGDESGIDLSLMYAKSIELAGGVPIIIGYTNFLDIPDIILGVSGILLSGGGDIDPHIFGEEPIPGLMEVSPLRDKFEMEIASIAIKNNIPILGICRGMQIIAVSGGGKLLQDINGQVKNPIKHSQSMPRQYPSHEIDIDKKSKLSKIIGKQTIRVNSSHHQAVFSVGDGFAIDARSKDNVVEAISHMKNDYCIGIQWHPECMAQTDEYAMKIFKSFIESCR